MTTKHEKILCRCCGVQLVEKDNNGKLRFGKHLKYCPALLIPETEGPARRVAKSKLICSDCPNQHLDIIDLGNGLAHCGKCNVAGLAKEARNYYLKDQGKKKSMDIIHPAPRKTVAHWKRLYLDLLQKYAMVLEELEQYKKGQR